MVACLEEEGRCCNEGALQVISIVQQSLEVCKYLTSETAVGVTWFVAAEAGRSTECATLSTTKVRGCS